MTNNYKIRKNLLKDYIYGKKSEKEYGKQTINGLFRAITEPLIDIPVKDAMIFLRILHPENFKSTVKRLTFSGTKIYSFNSDFSEENISDIEKENLWGTTEFVLVLAQRYSVAMIWDYSEKNNETSDVCLVFNSKSITEIAKIICENSKVDFSGQLKNFRPDRRENILLNTSIKKIADITEDLNREMKIKLFETQELSDREENFEKDERLVANVRFISHEIKNNISIINIYTKIASKRLESLSVNDENTRSLQNCIENVQYASNIITHLMNNLKCFSKPEIEEFYLKNLLEKIISVCLPKAEENNVTLNFECPDELKIYSDMTKLNNILLNLIFNSIEACCRDGNVSVEVSKQKQYIQILVKDTGLGILPENTGRIFDLKFTTKETGNGIGLALCKTLTEELNGQLNLVSSNKLGTTFEILLPV